MTNLLIQITSYSRGSENFLPRRALSLCVDRYCMKSAPASSRARRSQGSGHPSAQALKDRSCVKISEEVLRGDSVNKWRPRHRWEGAGSTLKQCYYYHCPGVCNVTGVCNNRFPPSHSNLTSSNFAQSLISPTQTWLSSFLGGRGFWTSGGFFLMVPITFDGPK